MSVCQTLVAESKLMAIKHLKTYIFLLNASRESWRRKLRARDTETNALVEFNNMFYMALNGMKIESTADKDRKRFEWSGREWEREREIKRNASILICQWIWILFFIQTKFSCLFFCYSLGFPYVCFYLLI